MIDCPKAEIRDRLPDFVHGQLGTAARAEVAAHAAICAACAAELALLRDLRATLRAAPSVDVARIVSALPAAPVRVVPPRAAFDRPAWRFDWRVAAAVVAMAAAGGSAMVLSRYAGSGNDAEPGSGVAQALGRGPAPATPDVDVPRVAAVSIDADLGDATAAELEELLAELDSFDGLPAGEPEPTLPTPGDEGVER